MRPTLCLLLSALLLGGCDRAGRPEIAAMHTGDATCASRPGGSRWAGAYREAGVFGDTEAEAIGGIVLAGIAAGDSTVYVMESMRARLWLLRPDLSLIRVVGREGRGPGEWRPFGAVTHGGSMAWIHASPDGIRLFDGTRIQQFRPDGRFLRLAINNALETGISPMQSRHRYVGDTLLYSAGGYDPFAGGVDELPIHRPEPVNGKSPWWVRAREGARERTVLELGLVPLERGAALGPSQARPLWDTNGDCVAVSDGAGPLLVRAALRGGRQDTVRAPLPDRRADAGEDRARLEGLVPPGVRLDVTAPVRVRDLAVDPDGYAWLLPVQPEGGVAGGVEVVRVELASGRGVLDTVPAFPRAFGAPGVFYAETHGPDDEIRVVRYDKQER